MIWNKEGFEKLILCYADPLYDFARTLTRSASDAEDLVQETYLRAIRYWDHYEPGTYCKAWLFKMMRNLYLNNNRDRRREVQLVDEILDFQEDRDESEHLKTTPIERPDIKIDLERALSDLPSDMKVVVLLRDRDGLEYQEIANILECPIGTVMSRLSRGRSRIKQFFSEE